MANGTVLVAGGGVPSTILANAEIYDPTTRTFTATLLANGTVLVVGGNSSATAELYKPRERARDRFVAWSS